MVYPYLSKPVKNISRFKRSNLQIRSLSCGGGIGIFPDHECANKRAHDSDSDGTEPRIGLQYPAKPIESSCVSIQNLYNVVTH